MLDFMREKAGDKNAFPGPLKKTLEHVSLMVPFHESWNNKIPESSLYQDAAATK